mmetsp:Transcript_116034/g.335084  ORF Transcript_116034/g.335084 Transcript_116034/m.335084 type:complete len:428 (-) Transcript_116034:71-1354(-)
MVHDQFRRVADAVNGVLSDRLQGQLLSLKETAVEHDASEVARDLELEGSGRDLGVLRWPVHELGRRPALRIQRRRVLAEDVDRRFVASRLPACRRHAGVLRAPRLRVRDDEAVRHDPPTELASRHPVDRPALPIAACLVPERLLQCPDLALRDGHLRLQDDVVHVFCAWRHRDAAAVGIERALHGALHRGAEVDARRRRPHAALSGGVPCRREAHLAEEVARRVALLEAQADDDAAAHGIGLGRWPMHDEQLRIREGAVERVQAISSQECIRGLVLDTVPGLILQVKCAEITLHIHGPHVLRNRHDRTAGQHLVVRPRGQRSRRVPRRGLDGARGILDAQVDVQRGLMMPGAERVLLRPTLGKLEVELARGDRPAEGVRLARVRVQAPWALGALPRSRGCGNDDGSGNNACPRGAGLAEDAGHGLRR